MFWSSCVFSPGLPALLAPYLSSLWLCLLTLGLCRSQTIALCRFSGPACDYSEDPHVRTMESRPSRACFNPICKLVMETSQQVCFLKGPRQDQQVESVLPGWITLWSNKQGTLETTDVHFPPWLRSDTWLKMFSVSHVLKQSHSQTVLTCWNQINFNLTFPNLSWHLCDMVPPPRYILL